MKRFVIILLGVVVALYALKVSAQTSSTEIIGKWYAEEMNQSVIEIVKANDGTLEGVIRASSNENFLNQRVIYDFKYSLKSKSYQGKIYSIARNMELDGTIELVNAKELKVTGKKYFFSKTYYWKQVK